MKKQGFTLVELLAVIIIIGLMGLIIIPTVNKAIRDFRGDTYENQIETIELAASNWATDNPYSLPAEDGGVTTITLGTLKSGGYVDADLKNPKTDKSFPNDLLIEITRKKKNFRYKVIEDSGSDVDVEYNERGPVIVLCGNSTEYVNLGADKYEEPKCEGTSYVGAMAYDYQGNAIPSALDKTSTVNTKKAGTYKITYVALYNNMTTSATRTVIVKDMEGPTITVNGSTENQKIRINKGSTYTIPVGSAVDNDGTTITNIKPSGTVDTKTAGSYRLTYQAEDKSGNQSKLELVVIVR